MSDGLDPWIVLYRDSQTPPITPPEAFACRAEDGDHAEEQCLNAYPGCDVLWTALGTADDAYAEYFDFKEEV
jgi:hypothetical protein